TRATEVVMDMAGSMIDAVLDVSGASGAIVVHSIRGREELSRGFRYEIDVTFDFLDLDAARDQVLALRASSGAGGERFLSGVVEEAWVLATHEEPARHRLVVVPKHRRLDYVAGFRIFQDLSVPDIVRQVFDD